MARTVACPVLVGRTRELDLLLRHLDEAVAARAGVVIVGGEAGVGKTRLVAELATIASGRGVRVGRGAAVPVGATSLPFGAFVEALRRLARTLDPTEVELLRESGRHDLAPLLPSLAATSADPTAPPAGSQTATGIPPPANGTAASGRPTGQGERGAGRTELFERFLALVGRLAASGPLMLVLEDLHWASRATLDLLDFVVRNVSDERLLLVATYRSDELLPGAPLLSVLGELERTRRVARVELAPLDAAGTRELVGAILGHEPDPALCDGIHARSGGNPYYAEELLALVDAAGPLPDTLRGVLLARIAGLPSVTRRLLDVAACVGSRIDAALVVPVTRLDEGAAAGALRQAVAHHVLEPLDAPGEHYEFRHALLAEAVYNALLPTDRRAIHAAYARLLQARASPADPDLGAQLAEHWHLAGDAKRALRAAVAAGLAARSAERPLAAAAQLEQAVQIWPEVPDAAAVAGIGLATLLELAAEAESFTGANDRAVADLRSAIQLVDPAADPGTAALLHSRLAREMRKRGDSVASRAAHETAVALVPADPPTAARAQVLAGFAQDLLLDGPVADAVRPARDAIRLARAVGAREIEVDALATLGMAEGLLGEPGRGLTDLRRARAMGDRIGAVEAASRAWINEAVLLDGEECAIEAHACVAWCDAHGLAHSAGARARCIGAFALLELGRPGVAETLIAPLEAAEPARSEMDEGITLVRAQVAAYRGRWDEAAAGEELLRRSQAAGANIEGQVLAAALEAEIAIAEARAREDWVAGGSPGDSDAAAAAHSAAVRALSGLAARPPGPAAFLAFVPARILRIEADLSIAHWAGRRAVAIEETRRVGREALEVAQRLDAVVTSGHRRWWRRPRVAAALCAAEWSRLEGEWDDRAWGAAARIAAEHGYRPALAYARLREAEAVLERRHDRVAATLVIRQAHDVAAAAGAEPLIRQIEDVARRGRLSLDGEVVARYPQRLSRSHGIGADLTPREREVLLLVVTGRTNRQIADELFIAEKTASVHVSNILGKLGVARRTEAAAVAHRLGLDEEPESQPEHRDAARIEERAGAVAAIPAGVSRRA